MGWPTLKLGDISELVTKGTTPTSVGFKFTETGVNFVKIESISSTGKFLPEKFAAISNECNQALKRSQLMRGDILFSIAGALGRTALVTDEILPANTNQAIALIRLKNGIEVDKHFLLLALSTGVILEQIEKNRGGVAQQNLSLGQLKGFEIPLPPIPEQKRIVAILDEAFAAIDRARELTERNLQNARELFDSYLNQIFTQKGEGDLGEDSGVGMMGRPTESLGDLCKLYQPKTISKKEMIPNGEFPVYGANGIIGKYDQFNHDTDQLLVTCRGATCGEVNISHGKSWINGNAMVIAPKDDRVILDYLKYFFIGGVDLSSVISGAAQPQITRQGLSPVEIPLPPINEQKRIAAILDALSTEKVKLENQYTTKLESLDELKKSILQKAFSGELTQADAMSLAS